MEGLERSDESFFSYTRKKWWEDNGKIVKKIVIGIVVGVAVVGASVYVSQTREAHETV